MTQSTSFRINSPKIARETIDGEVVIINLDKGYYYSLVKAGTDIWDGIERGLSRDHLIAEMTQQYDSSRADLEHALDNFLAELQQEELIVLEQTDALSTNRSNEPTKPSTSKEKVSFEPPVLQKYTDMEDLLTLDPIHDVDETGWPSVKQV